MPIESPVNSIQDLNELWPLGTDLRSTLDDHCRLIKKAVKSLLTNPQQLPGYPLGGTEPGQILVWDGSAWGPTRPITPFSVKSSSFTADRLGRYYVNASGVTVTLPPVSALVDGDWVELIVTQSNVVVARNGVKIMGLNEDMTIDIAPAWVRLVYIGPFGDWRIAS